MWVCFFPLPDNESTCPSQVSRRVCQDVVWGQLVDDWMQSGWVSPAWVYRWLALVCRLKISFHRSNSLGRILETVWEDWPLGSCRIISYEIAWVLTSCLAGSVELFDGYVKLSSCQWSVVRCAVVRRGVYIGTQCVYYVHCHTHVQSLPLFCPSESTLVHTCFCLMPSDADSEFYFLFFYFLYNVYVTLRWTYFMSGLKEPIIYLSVPHSCVRHKPNFVRLI